jgi:hypothetical protein
MIRKRWRGVGLKVLLAAPVWAAGVMTHAAESESATELLSNYGKAAEHYATLTGLYRAAGTCPGRSDAMVQKQRQLAQAVSGLTTRDGSRVLLYAVAANSLPDVQRLLAVDAPLLGDDGTLLHVAARYGDPPLLEALVNAGMSVNQLGGSMGTSSGSALTVAVGDGRRENAAWLIQHGADVNVKNPRGGTPLTYAVVACKDQATVSMLIEAGAQLDVITRNLANERGFELHTKAALATRGRLSPPAGWHGPTPDELNGEPLRNNLPTKYVEAKADFDGDRKEDHAALFTADDGKSEAVFVKLSSRKPEEWVIAASMAHARPSMGVGMGISVAPPGARKTACGNGYWQCKTGEPAEVNLKYPGIDFFRFESAGSIVYWDRATKQFRQVWISD